MLNIIKKLGSLNLAPVSPDTDRCVEILSHELPFIVHEFKSGMEHNGWVVPSSWWTESAKICLNGEMIYDGKSHPLGVIGYSQSFCGEVTYSELMAHIFTHKDRPNDLVYHCQLYYRLGEENWGFSMPQDMVNSMESDKYQVLLSDFVLIVPAVIKFVEISCFNVSLRLDSCSRTDSKLFSTPSSFHLTVPS